MSYITTETGKLRPVFLWEPRIWSEPQANSDTIFWNPVYCQTAYANLNQKRLSSHTAILSVIFWLYLSFCLGAKFNLTKKQKIKAQHIIPLKMLTEEDRSRSHQYECCNICGIQLLAEVSILIYMLRATTVKFITCYIFRSYGQFIHSLVFSLRGRFGRNQSPVMWPVWL